MSKIDLPEKCYSTSPYTGMLVEIHRGDRFYAGVPIKDTAAALNRELGVTKAQEAAMLGGVRLGWDSPHADPANYTDDGTWKGGRRDGGK